MWKVNKQQTCEIETQDHKHVKKNLKQNHIIRDKEQNKRARVFGQDHAYAWTSLCTHNPFYIRRLVHAYAWSCPETLALLFCSLSRIMCFCFRFLSHVYGLESLFHMFVVCLPFTCWLFVYMFKLGFSLHFLS